jgi:D-glycero-D-manno-heptose 1,7-bisphosphate phosphatase
MGVDEMNKAVILDRDGTLIAYCRDEDSGRMYSAFHPDHVQILPGVRAGLLALQRAGYILAVATNQPGPAKGQYSENAIINTNTEMLMRLIAMGIRIAKVAVCTHHPVGRPCGDQNHVLACACRKPKPGLIDALDEELDIDRANSWMVGDSYDDVECGRAAGLKTALLMTPGRCDMCEIKGRPMPDIVAPMMHDVARRIMAC